MTKSILWSKKRECTSTRTWVQKNMWFFYFYIKDFTLTVLLSTSFYAVFWKKINFNLKGSNDTGLYKMHIKKFNFEDIFTNFNISENLSSAEL